MGSSVYVASVEGYSGKSAIALGVLEQLSRRVRRVGVFRPIVRADSAQYRGRRDFVLELLTAHEAVSLSYDECAGVTYDEVHEDPGAALDRIVERFHQVAAKCDAVVVVGSDYTDVGSLSCLIAYAGRRPRDLSGSTASREVALPGIGRLRSTPCSC